MTKTDLLFKEFNKKFGEEICSKGTVVHKCERIPFSSPGANRLLYGGIPRGRLIEFAGDEGGGKTTTSLDITANAQKLFKDEWEQEVSNLESLDKLSKQQSERLLVLRENGPLKVLWADCENTFDDDWATKLGVIVDELLFMAPKSQGAEEIFEMIIQLIDTGEIGLVVIDSLGVMLSNQAYEKSVEEKTYGGIAQALTTFSKKAEASCAKTNCALIGINQLRENMNAGYGGPTTITVGGKAWKHNCSVRLSFKKGSFFDESYKEVKKSCENPYGNQVQISVVKTKVCKPDRKLGHYTLSYDNGIVPLIDLIELCIFYDVIHKSGAWFTFIDGSTGEVFCDDDGDVLKVQGQQNIAPFLKEHPDILEVMQRYVDNLINGVSQ